MPRFYFDIDDGEGIVPDDKGIICRSRENLQKLATNLLPEIARDALPNKTTNTLTVKVRDKSGRYVFQATLSLVTEWIDEPPETGWAKGQSTANIGSIPRVP
jgi:hypothetical protein